MSKLTIILSASAAVGAAAFLALPESAAAQQRGNIAEIIVYGDDPCPRSTDDQVVVCARRPEVERYRIPRTMRTSGTPQETQSWAVQSQALETVGATGVNSCSAVGPGGHTGCLTKIIKQATGERKQQADDAIPPQ